MFLAQAISDAALALATADIKYYAISQRISTYADYVAAAERLLKQPIPRAYTRWVLLPDANLNLVDNAAPAAAAAGSVCCGCCGSSPPAHTRVGVGRRPLPAVCTSWNLTL